MTTKTTLRFSRLNPLYISFLAVMLLTSTHVFAQVVVDDVFPTQVTYKTKVTIMGTGFSTAARDGIRLGTTSSTTELIGITNLKISGTTFMSFDIDHPPNSGEADFSRNLYIGGVDMGIVINYVVPTYRTLSNTSPFFIEEIYTNWDRNHDGNGFWRSNDWKHADKTTWPNDKHELLGFKMYNGTIFSTGVDDDLLKLKLGPTVVAGDYQDARFKAYSTNGVEGKTNSGHYILTGDLIDGLVGAEETATNNDLTTLNEIENLTIFDVIIDGKNGLELGTGISNFNKETSVKFYSGNGKPGTAGDNVPDVLITQIAQAGGSDIYYYADERGNIVGTPIKLSIPISTNVQLAQWKLDLFSFTSKQQILTAHPKKRGFTHNPNEVRPITMLAFKLEDFDINDDSTSTGYIKDIKNINMMAGGTSDLAFLAYNAATFDIKSPMAKPLLSKFVCKVDGTTNVTFEVIKAGVDDGNGGIADPANGEELSFEWLKYNIPYNDPNNTNDSVSVTEVDSTDLATYKVKISNAFGTIILPVSLSQGGTPTYWNNGTWDSPYGVVDSKEKSLIFSTSYSEDGNLEGCDCMIAAGSNVAIPDGFSMVLYDKITVQPEVPEVVGETSYLAAGTFTLEDNASLVQTKPVTANQNSGSIKMKREASGLHTNDYVYWSSPVEGFDHANIPGNRTYEWDTNVFNTGNNTEGNWVSPTTTTMTAGKGYIKRVSNGANFIAEFFGTPNNGKIDVDVKTTSITNPDPVNDSNWNLIGNPYPSAVDATKFLTDNEKIVGYVQIWKHDTPISASAPPFYDNGFVLNYGNQYIEYNGTGSNPKEFNGYIAAGQGFFVQAMDNNSAIETVSFTNDMRYNESENAYNNEQFYRTDGSESGQVNLDKQLIWLGLVTENNMTVTTLIGYVDGATLGKDRLYDAYSSQEDFSIYSLLDDDSKLSIQGRPLPFTNTDLVPLGVTVPQNGIYKIALDNLEGSVFVDQAQAIYVEDTYLNVVHDLRLSPYSFTGETGTVTDRFVLRYTPDESLAVNEAIALETFAFIKNSELQIRSSQTIETIQIYDLNGKRIANYKPQGNSKSFSANFQVARGVYLAVITLENDLVVKKKLIN